jgi:hypothetical protein
MRSHERRFFYHREHRGKNAFFSVYSVFSVVKFLILITTPLLSLEQKPWLGDQWEFKFIPTYTYSRYRNVQGAHPQLRSVSNDNVLSLDLGWMPGENFDIYAELEFAKTPRMKGFRSGALQGRYLWMSDVVGDPVSLTTGLVVRGVSGKGLRDVSTPYHAQADFELHSAVGKEWGDEMTWGFRSYALAAVGMANRGYPWARGLISIAGNFHDQLRLNIFTEGYFGFGPERVVNTRHFNGYANVYHQSIDVGAQFDYLFDIWGTLRFAYTRRVFAKSFPTQVNFFTVSYILPFSAF